MREILFRGKRADTGDWVKGFYVQKPNQFSEDGKPIRHCIVDLPPFGYDINPETVGQFTGLLDKNGARIFEGDIIRTSKYGKVRNDNNSNGEDTFCVVYRPAQFRLEREKPPRGFNLVDDGFSKMEVIGNIHDNPELLEGGGEDADK